MDNRIIQFGKLIFGILIFLWLVYFGGIENAINSLVSFDLRLAFPLLILFLVVILITGFNLKLLFDAKKKMESKEFFLDFLSSWSIGFILPGKIGDFSLAYFLKDKFSVGESSAIILLDKAIGIAVLSVLGSFSIFLFSESDFAGALVLILFAWFLGIVFLFTGSGRNTLKKILPKRITEKFAGFSSTLNYFLKNEKKRIAINFVLSFARLVLQAWMLVIIFSGIGVNAEIFDIALILAATTLLSFIPLTASGIGIREGAFAFLALQIGIPIAKTVSASIISIFLNYLVVALIMLGLLERTMRFIGRKKQEKLQ